MKTYSIVGMNWLKSEEVVGRLKPGTLVTLAREPTNQVDPNAVAVYADGVKVGYVPKKSNVALAAFIDQLGSEWWVPDSEIVAHPLAQDGSAKVELDVRKAIPAKFGRSPNSGYPQVTIDD